MIDRLIAVLGLTMAGKTVTRADLCEVVYQKVGLSRSESASLVELVLKEVIRAPRCATCRRA